MAYNEILAGRVRAALAHGQHVEEKKMFGGIAFMVNGKMCITVGRNRLMCRIDPELHDTAVKRKGVRTVTMKGREYRGYVHVNVAALRSQRDFDYWINLCLEFNKRAVSSQNRKSK